MKIRPRSLRLQVMWPSTIGTEQAPAALVKRRLNAERRSSSLHRRDHPQRDHHQRDHPQKDLHKKDPHSKDLLRKNPHQKDHQQQQQQQQNKKPHLKDNFYHQKEFHQKVKIITTITPAKSVPPKVSELQWTKRSKSNAPPSSLPPPSSILPSAKLFPAVTAKKSSPRSGLQVVVKKEEEKKQKINKTSTIKIAAKSKAKRRRGRTPSKSASIGQIESFMHESKKENKGHGFTNDRISFSV
ncbi:hypothetical protein TYRP_020598 [Tyrophagus putrescentiae]|nr:hypothetical protein TYRP_020598 [Tyrophagus putrescentiae]